MFEQFKETRLKDCPTITVRKETPDDLDAISDFYHALPQEEQDWLKININDKAEIARRFEDMEDRQPKRLLAFCNEKNIIVGEAILEKLRYKWMRRTGEIKILVLPEFSNETLVQSLAQEVFLQAARHGLVNIVAHALDSEKDMFEILKSLHFKHEATQKNHAVDNQGNTHDVYTMTFSLQKMWEDIEESFRSTDPMHREH